MTRLRNDLHCVEWDVKLYYTIPYRICDVSHLAKVGLPLFNNYNPEYVIAVIANAVISLY